MKKFFRAIAKRKKQIALVLLLAFIAIQFIRPERNSGMAANANDIMHFTTVSPEVKAILEKSCYDCHSDHTEYPWYTNIQPAGWWMQDHVNEGKREVNFSQFNTYRVKRKMRKFHEIVEQLEEDEMPLNSYLWIHKDAVLGEADRKILSDWAFYNQKELEKQYPDSVMKR